MVPAGQHGLHMCLILTTTCSPAQGGGIVIRKYQRVVPENLWNRLARNLIYDAKQVLLYCGVRVPERKKDGIAVDYSDFIGKITKGTNYGIIVDVVSNRIHFQPEFIQDIIEQATRFDFPVYDKSFGPGGVAAYVLKQGSSPDSLEDPTLNHILQQAVVAKNNNMPFGFVCARQLAMFEVEQFRVTTRIFAGPNFFNVSTRAGIDEAEKHLHEDNFVITNHSVFDSPLTLTFKEKLDVFCECVEREIPVMLVTQPMSGQTAPMTPYGLALLAFSEFLAGMAMAYAINPRTRVINGAYPTMCTPGSNPQMKIGTVVHNFVNYLVAYTTRLLDIASIQSGCTMEGARHEKTTLETDYETVRGMLLWENMFEGWHMLRHCYGFVSDLITFSFEKAEADIDALHHIQGLDENGIMAILANNIRLNRDYNRADEIYRKPTKIFDREDGRLVEVIAVTMELFGNDFGKHDHTLQNIPQEWF